MSTSVRGRPYSGWSVPSGPKRKRRPGGAGRGGGGGGGAEGEGAPGAGGGARGGVPPGARAPPPQEDADVRDVVAARPAPGRRVEPDRDPAYVDRVRHLVERAAGELQG